MFKWQGRIDSEDGIEGLRWHQKVNELEVGEDNSLANSVTLVGFESDTVHSLINLKSKGNLTHPSDDVIRICMCCEKMFRETLCLSQNNYGDISLSRKKFQKIVIMVTESFITQNIFPTLYGHMFDTEPSHNHLVLQLCCETFHSKIDISK